MKNSKSHFTFNRGQRNGIFLLLTLILAIFSVWLFFPFENNVTFSVEEKNEIADLQGKIDSLKLVENEKGQPKIYPFNPNFITDYKGYKLGMSTEEIDRLHKFREKDQWVNSKEDFQKVTKVSDAFLAKISPFFDFPDWVTEKNKQPYQDYSKEEVGKELPFHLKKDLNTATAANLEKIKGIGKTLARRIIRYRTKLDGFVSDIQLKDIYGLDYEVTQRLTNKFTVKDTATVQKISINKATLAQLSEIPYFNYELARKIKEYRILHEGIKTFEELAKINGFPAYQIERIKLYLTL